MRWYWVSTYLHTGDRSYGVEILIICALRLSKSATWNSCVSLQHPSTTYKIFPDSQRAHSRHSHMRLVNAAHNPSYRRSCRLEKKFEEVKETSFPAHLFGETKQSSRLFESESLHKVTQAGYPGLWQNDTIR